MALRGGLGEQRLPASSSHAHAQPRQPRQPLQPLRSRRRGLIQAASRAQKPRLLAGAHAAGSAQQQLLEPISLKEACAFAPATVANLGPGYDWMGCAVDGGGDTVVARALPGRPGQVVIDTITGDRGRLTLDPTKNCIGIAAAETLRLLGPTSCGVALTLQKGLPLGSGLGSSAASAAAAAWAVNGLFGSVLSKRELIVAGLEAEAAVSGYHADNVGPSLLGGFILIRSCTPGEPLQLLQLPYGGKDNLFFVLVNPVFEAPTKEMRAVLPKEVPMKALINNCCQGGSLVAGILSGDAQLLGSALDSDVIIEPVRGPLIPGLVEVKAAAKAAGAFGCTISGAGPTAVAVVGDRETGQRVLEAMSLAFMEAGKLDVNSAIVAELDPIGARLI